MIELFSPANYLYYTDYTKTRVGDPIYQKRSSTPSSAFTHNNIIVYMRF